jgi:hypothetical protein
MRLSGQLTALLVGTLSLNLEAIEPPIASMINFGNNFGKCESKKKCEPKKTCEPVQDTCCLPKSRGSFSVDYTVAYGRTKVTSDNIINSAFLEPLLQNLFNTRKKSGGFSTRVFANALADVSDNFSIGAEVGFSWYPTSRYSQSFLFDLTPLGADFSVLIDNSVKNYSYGADILINMTIYCIPEFFFTLKPGVQLAYQKNIVSSDLDFGLGALLPGLNIGIPSSGKYRNTKFLPEIILGAGWNFLLGSCARKNMRKYAIVMEIDYQHVFGQDSAPVNKRVNSRDMIGISAGIRL